MKKNLSWVGAGLLALGLVVGPSAARAVSDNYTPRLDDTAYKMIVAAQKELARSIRCFQHMVERDQLRSENKSAAAADAKLVKDNCSTYTAPRFNKLPL